MMCAAGPGKDSCHNDSGGTLIEVLSFPGKIGVRQRPRLMYVEEGWRMEK